MVYLPANVAKIYTHCTSALQDGQTLLHFNAIAEIGLTASEPHSFDFFGLRKRDAVTQRFYDLFREAYAEKERFIPMLGAARCH
ncbi:hypothetical protein AQUSIP_10540 [Aquicella siphonis]|uniref:Uncharacterized protein n=2 Tax=Aquicella siphonis TaxID=254247 RepID=A0A5E4PFJ5_9COXI|nr:hypothetical protein AQUSIP_10540 [Aquicella siphonis]